MDKMCFEPINQLSYFSRKIFNTTQLLHLMALSEKKLMNEQSDADNHWAV